MDDKSDQLSPSSDRSVSGGVDLTVGWIEHRALRTDLTRTLRLLDHESASMIGRGQARALARYLRALVDATIRHHSIEDDLIWPLLERTPGVTMDLAPFRDDHRLLDDHLRAVGEFATRFAAEPEARSAGLVIELRALIEHFFAHLDREEAEVFPVLGEAVSVAEYRAVEAEAKRRFTPSDLTFLAPWLASYASTEERNRALTQNAGHRVLLAAARPFYRRLENQAFRGWPRGEHAVGSEDGPLGLTGDDRTEEASAGSGRSTAEPVACPFPFAPGPAGSPSDEFAQRQVDDALGWVTLPSTDAARLIVRHDDACAVLADPRFSRDLSAPGSPRFRGGFDLSDIPDLLPNMDPPSHTRLRRLLAPAFTPKSVRAWQPAVAELLEGLVERLANEGPEVDVLDWFAYAAPVSVICHVMGVPEFDVPQVRAWSDAMLSTATVPAEEEFTAAAEFAAYAELLVAQCRRERRPGLLSDLIDLRDGGDKLTEDELVRTTVSLLVGGHESTASVLPRGLVRLLCPRDAYAAIVEDPEVLEPTVEEVLRLEVPTDYMLLRLALEDVDLPSGLIRAGEAVLVSGLAANLDPEVFDDPGGISLRRGGPSHLTFGRGAHYCLAANLARMELVEIFRALTRRLPDLELVEDPVDIPWTIGQMSRRPERLLVRL